MVIVVPVSACPAGRLHPCRQAGKSVAVRCGWDLALVRGGETTLHGIADVDVDAVAGVHRDFHRHRLTLGVSAGIGQPLLDGSVCDFPCALIEVGELLDVYPGVDAHAGGARIVDQGVQ